MNTTGEKTLHLQQAETEIQQFKLQGTEDNLAEYFKAEQISKLMSHQYESYTAYLHIGEYILEFTTSRDSFPASDVGTLDFGTKTVNYSGTATSDWVGFPFLSEDTEFTLTGDGNPTAQTVNGQRANAGTVRWGTNIKADIPEPGETRVIEFEILEQTGIFTIIRQ